jgi:hypothetical protein
MGIDWPLVESGRTESIERHPLEADMLHETAVSTFPQMKE